MFRSRFFRAVLSTALLILAGVLFARVSSASPSPRVIDDADRVVLHGNVHPNAQPQFDAGPSDMNLPMERMILVLSPRPGAQKALERFLRDVHDPDSPLFHQWLTPEQFGERFGVSRGDLSAVVGWLQGHGFAIDEIAKGRGSINFSGSASQVERAFRTEMHDYFLDGRLHHANRVDISIPRGLSDIVKGVVSLHDFPKKAMNTGIHSASDPDYTSGSSHYLSPGDFAIIYNVNALYSAGIDGTGQTIAIVGRTHPSATNWSTFRTTMNLPSNPPQVIVNGTDPGDIGAGEDGEADLDVEWSGAVARKATIKFVVSKSTTSTDGVDLSAQYIINNNLAPVMSTSFGQCESSMGSAENTFYNNLWSQAVSQGITSFVSSGDSGASGCDGGSATSGTGRAVSGLSSTPYNVAVGGTQFNEGSGSYWSSTNSTGDVSALSYIPEKAWNESGTVSGGSGLWATGGGVSTIYSKPSWQVSPGVPADGKRDVPDVSLTAASHDGYLVQTQGSLQAIGGTSASSPSFAGLMALIVQKTGARQGNANTVFYSMGNSQYGSGGTAVFHDSTTGNNSVPSVTGFSCGTGYDAATGLGTVDAAALANNWGGAPPTPDFAISASPTSKSVAQGSTGTVTISTTVSGGFNSAVSLSASGQPSGVTVSFSPTSIAAPGSGSSTMTFTVGAAAAAGTYSITVTGSGGSKTHAASVSLTVTTSGGGGSVLSNGVPVSNLSGATGSQQNWTMSVPSGATNLKFTISGGTGDADMYVKFGAAPTLTTYDCRPYVSGNSETCTFAAPGVGTYYVMLNGYAAYSGVTLTGSYTAGSTDTTAPTTSVTAPANGSTVSGTVNATATSSDNVGVTKLEIYVDGALKASNTGSASISYSWATTGVANGSHSLVSKAYDAAGNVGTSSTVTVTVSNSGGTSSQLISNTGFEGTLTPWVTGGAKIPIVSTARIHTGADSARMGWSSGTTVPAGDSTIYQSVSIPSNATAATLTFWYSTYTQDTISYDWQEAQIQNSSGTKLAQIFKISGNNSAWTQQTVDLSAYKGQTIRIYFNCHSDGDGLLTSFWVDDVTVNVTQ